MCIWSTRSTKWTASSSREAGEPSAPGRPPASGSSLPQNPFPVTPAGPLPRPPSSDSSRAFASDPLPATPAGPLPQLPGGTLTDTQWPVKVYMLNKDQEWDIQGAGHVVQLCGVTERHVHARHSLTKHRPQEKRKANHFSILALRTPWIQWKGKKIWHWKMNPSGW